MIIGWNKKFSLLTFLVFRFAPFEILIINQEFPLVTYF